MGVDQYTSAHIFDALADGGRIELQRDVDDPAGVLEIRRHLGKIAEAFASGDFSTPAFVHMREVAGTAVMAAKKDRIEYVYRDLPRGAELRLVTNDPEALRAIHEFVAFQRADHRAGGMDQGHGTMHHGTMDHATMRHGAMDHGTMHHGEDHRAGGMDHGAMGHGMMHHGSMDPDAVGHESAAELSEVVEDGMMPGRRAGGGMHDGHTRGGDTP